MAGYKSSYGGTSMCDFRGWIRHFRNALGLRILPVAFVLIAWGNAFAQTTGTLLGIVSDQNGAVVPSATVKAQNTDTGFTVTVKASSEGSYLIPLLPLGHYSISVEVSGFKTFTRSGVLVPVGQDIRVDVKMEVGEVSQTVAVVSDAVNIDTANATIGATVEKASLN